MKTRLAFLALLLLSAPLAAAQKNSRVVEMRAYNLKPGARERFTTLFEREALPLLER
jgi:hypothetical protein